MTTSYTGVFGSDIIPPSEYSYAAVSLTANTTFEWPQLATSANLIASLMDVTPTDASSFTLKMPAANQVSTAMPVLMRNIGSATFTVADSAGGVITTIASGVSKLIYITSNATEAGTWANLTYGTGTSAADAATLAGYGTKAVGATLATKIDVTTKSEAWTVTTADRASLFVVTSGTFPVTLPTAASVAADFYVMIRNSGTGSVTIDPDSGELIDGSTTLVLAPSESVFIVCSGSAWYSIGYGRSTQFQFTKLVKNIAGSGGTFTLTSTEASNKLIQFTGAVTGNNIIVVPDVVAVYYLQNDYTGTAETLTIKTASGTGPATDINSRTIVYCDGVNVTLAQTSAAPAASIAGGTAGALVYQAGSGTTGFSAAGTTGQLVVSGGTGAPTFTSTPTVTSINKVAITAPAASATLTIAEGKTLTANASITIAGTDATTMTFPATSGNVSTAQAVQAQTATSFTTGGTSTAYTLTPTPALSALAAGQEFDVTFHTASGTTPTLAISGLTAKNVKYRDSTGAKQAVTSTQVPSGWMSKVVYDGTDYIVREIPTAAASSGGSGFSQDFRLTLTTSLPVTTADVTGATTIYCTPYKGNQIALYDGAAWNTRTSAEFSLALGTLTSGKPYDVFCYDNAGTPTLEFLVWTNDTTRATALAYQDGVLAKSGSTTRRYLGTFYTTATTTTEDSKAKRYLWNYYNRVERYLTFDEATATWTYSTAAWRLRNNAAGNQLFFVVGVAEDAIRATAKTKVSTNFASAFEYNYMGIGLDATTSVYSGSGTTLGTRSDLSASGFVDTPIPPQIGAHYIAALEQGAGSSTQTWVGTDYSVVSAFLKG